MSDETRVYMGVFSDVRSPEEITSAIGLKPDDCHRRGDLVQETSLRHKKHCCRWNSGLPSNESLDIHVSSTLDRLGPWSEKFRALSTKDEIRFTCVIYAKHSPLLHFEEKTLEQIATFGACLDIDLYVFGDDNDAPDITKG